MSQLHTYINKYIQIVETWKTQYTTSQSLLNAAETKWGQESPPYKILQESPTELWKNAPDETPPEVDKSDDNLLINYLPTHISTLQDLVLNYPDDESLLEAAKKRYREESYLYRLIVWYQS